MFFSEVVVKSFIWVTYEFSNYSITCFTPLGYLPIFKKIAYFNAPSVTIGRISPFGRKVGWKFYDEIPANKKR